jgi:hypothetical protein
MKTDNERDRFAYGYDAGQIIDGTVQQDPKTGTLLIVDDEGVGFDVLQALSTLKGKKVRLTMVTMEAMLNIEGMLHNEATQN